MAINYPSQLTWMANTSTGRILSNKAHYYGIDNILPDSKVQSASQISAELQRQRRQIR